MPGDDAEFDSVGRYGTIALLKRDDPSVVITAFGIETEEVTFGRDASCSVRLYYPDVSPVHCKIIFEDRKAFLEVHGASGLTVDGCNMRPKNASTPATVSLSNNSIIEIRQKTFRFSYPPKEIRAQLFASPAPDDRRKLRMSMIQSAQVFSPHPSPNPKENLRVLQSPLKPFRGPAQPSPLKGSIEHADESEVVVLVEGNNPRVVQEDNDLVILEHVDEEPPSASPTETGVFSLPPANRVPQTPQRRGGRPTLHKAVLLRSAQRAMFRAEAEDAEEEQEVLGTIVAEDEDSGDEEGENSDSESESEEEPKAEASGWRESLVSIWPFRASMSPPKQSAQPPTEEEGEEGQPQDDDMDMDMEEAEEQEPNPFSGPSRPLKSFMTPQHKPKPSGINFASARRSLGGQQARFGVKSEQQDAPVWRVRDITVPVVKAELSSPVRGTPRESATAEERRAIKERRKSVHKTPDPFFGGNIPGMSPDKRRHTPDSPTKLLRAIAESAEDKEEEEQNDIDYQEMLQNIKRTTDLERQNLMSAKQRRLSTFTPEPSSTKVEDEEPMQGVEATAQEEDDEEEQMRRLREGIDEDVPMQTEEAQPEESIPNEVPSGGLSSARRVAEALLEASNPAILNNATEESPSLADDEATPGNSNPTRDEDDDDEPMVQDEEEESRPKPRLLRGKTPPAIADKEPNATRSRAKPSSATKTATSIKPPSATRKPTSKTVTTDDEDAAPTTSRPTRSQKPPSTATAIPAAKRTTRRTNGGESSADESAGPSKPALRKPVVRKKPAGNVSSDDESSAAPTRSTRGRKAAAVSTESTVELETVNEEEPEEPKAKRGRPKKAVVKEEEEPVAVAPPARSTRAKKTLEPPVPLTERKNKPVVEITVPAKATRSRKAPVKEEVMTEPEMRPRTTRATRSRTKTAD